MINKALITRRVVKRFLAFACASIMCVNMLGCGKMSIKVLVTNEKGIVY